MDAKETSIPRDREMQKEGFAQVDDDRSSLSSYDAQHGVKNIEAVSQTWTKWALVAAYAGYVVRNCFDLVLRGRGARILTIESIFSPTPG